MLWFVIIIGRRQLLARLGALAPGVVWLAGFAACAALRSSRAYLSAALWGLLLLTSFVAWGRVVQRALGDRRRLGWAFDGSVGMAATLAVFGVLACVRLVSVPPILIWAAAGPLLEAALRLRAAPPPSDSPAAGTTTVRGFAAALLARRPSLIYAVGIGLLWTMAALQYCHSVTDATFNAWDDNMAYRSFVQQFLDTGTLYEPFSYRRVASYGGASLLQALVLAFTDRDRIHILDNGIALLLTLGLLTSYRAGPRRTVRAGILVAGLLLLTLPYERHNLGGQMTGVVLFLAVFRLLDDSTFDTHAARANAVLGGLLAAAICTQRQNYIAAATGFVALFYLLRAAYTRRTEWRVWLRQGAMAGIATVAFLLPWGVLAFINAGTAFYPLMNGNVNSDFGSVGRVPIADEFKWSLWLLLRFKPLVSISLLFLAAALVPFVRRTRALHAFMLASTFAFALMMHYFRTFADAESILRYLFAFTLAFCLASVLRTFREGARPGGTHAALAATALAAVAVGTQILSAREKTLELYSQRIDAAAQIFDRVDDRRADDSLAAFYRRLQESVPPGEPILVTLDHTYYLDGRRNRIYNNDHPGTTGPRGGPPAFKGPEAFASYLGSVGIRYYAYVFGPSSPEYKRDQWEGARIEGRQGIWLQRQARFALDYFDTVTALAASRRSVFHEGDVRVLDLATPAVPPASSASASRR
jgi:hypothetical protein